MLPAVKVAVMTIATLTFTCVLYFLVFIAVFICIAVYTGETLKLWCHCTFKAVRQSTNLISLENFISQFIARVYQSKLAHLFSFRRTTLKRAMGV